jgi:hypothetical protein
MREREAERHGSSRRYRSAVSASSFAHASTSRELQAVRRLSGHPAGVVFTIRDGRVIRMAWRGDTDEAFAEFAEGG